MMSFEQSETDRMLAGMLIRGTVEAVDLQAARVRMRSGEWVSAWLPWAALAAGEVRHWRPPSVGEQAMLLAPSGMPEQGTVLVGLYTQRFDQPDTAAHTVVWQMPDGARFEYNWQAGRLAVTGTKSVVVENAETIDVRSGGAVTVTAPSITLDAQQTTITGNVTIGGTLSQGAGGGGNATFGGIVTAAGDVVGAGISLGGHTHTEQGDGAETSAAH